MKLNELLGFKEKQGTGNKVIIPIPPTASDEQMLDIIEKYGDTFKNGSVVRRVGYR